ncbi:MAG: beta-galactosidase trimerization domain-containing protein, partial [Edaphobacter sp.]
LNPNVVVELNPHGIFGVNRAFLSGVDHVRLLPHGSVFWSEEQNEAQVDSNGILISKIRSMKLARSLNETMFSYTGPERANAKLHSYRLLMAESMAFNRNSLGDLGAPLDAFKWPDDLLRYVRFYHDQNQHYSATHTVADIAVLRSFPSLAYNSLDPQLQTTLMEQLLIQYKLPFNYVFDQNLGDLSKYRVLILADQESLSDRAVQQITAFVRGGGNLVVTGRTSLYTDWRRTRKDYGLADVLGIHAGQPAPESKQGRFGQGRVAYVRDVVPGVSVPSWAGTGSFFPIAASGFGHAYWKLPKNSEDLIAAIRYAEGQPFPVEFKDAPLTTVMELTEKNDGSERILHWLNYQLGSPVPPSSVSVAIPSGKRVQSIELISPDRSSESLQFKSADGRVEFTLPQMEVYNVAVINLK